MKVKRFKQYLEEKYLEERRLGGRIYSSSYTSMLDVIKNFRGKEARFIIDKDDKMRFGDAEVMIHWSLVVNDSETDYLDLPYNQVEELFETLGRYAGYIDLQNKTFSVAKIGGSSYGNVGTPSGKLKTIIDFLARKGLERLPDGDWPR